MTQLDCHMSWYHADMRSFKEVVRLAEKYGLPVRYPNESFARTLMRRGIMTTDAIIYDLSKHPGAEKKKHFFDLGAKSQLTPKMPCQ
ncbi:MAG: hypothetical protein AB1742_00990 [bacterium]